MLFLPIHQIRLYLTHHQNNPLLPLLLILPPPLLQILEVRVERLYNHQMIAASRFEGESVSKLSKATNLELKTVHLYVDILEID